MRLALSLRFCAANDQLGTVRVDQNEDENPRRHSLSLLHEEGDHLHQQPDYAEEGQRQ